MSNQNEFSSFKLLLKQVYSAHSTKVKDLESENKILREKLTKKERENNSSLPECKRCIELEEAFKSYKKALHDQSKLFENFGQKFSIFNSPGLENQDLKSVVKSPNCTPEKIKNSKIFKSDVTTCNENEPSVLSLGESTITENRINGREKISLASNNQNLLKKVMQDDENLESVDVYTVTFPNHLKHGHATAKFDSLIFAPDSLDTTPDNKNVCERNSNDNHSGEYKNKKTLHSNEHEKFKDTEKHQQENKGSGKRLSSDFLNDNRAKKCNMGKQVESSSKLSKPKDGKTKCDVIPPKILVTEEIANISKQIDMKSTTAIKDLNAEDVHIMKKKNIVSDVMESKDNKSNTPQNQNFLNNVKKFTPNETSPSLLPINVNAPPKIIDLEAISNDNDDFQEQVPSSRSVQNEEPWDVCDKKKPVKKNRNVKSIKSTSKYKMTLDAPPLNYKKPAYKQTKLSKSLFQVRDNNCKKSPEKLSFSKNLNPKVIDEDSSPTVLQDRFQTSTPFEAIKSPCTVDIDATFIPENFRGESTQCVTTNVKKNTVEKSHLKNGSLFSNISFPEELQSSVKNEDPNGNENEIEDHSPYEDSELKENMNSFDRLPLPEEPNYKYKNDVVRKKSERRQLNGFDCQECEKYYSELGLSDKEKKERMKKCSRHRGKYTPPSTPDHFWELEFPDTQECKARGYMNQTQKVKLNNICNI